LAVSFQRFKVYATAVWDQHLAGTVAWTILFEKENVLTTATKIRRFMCVVGYVLMEEKKIQLMTAVSDSDVFCLRTRLLHDYPEPDRETILKADNEGSYPPFMRMRPYIGKTTSGPPENRTDKHDVHGHIPIEVIKAARPIDVRIIAEPIGLAPQIL